jgi:hypothetical protein
MFGLAVAQWPDCYIAHGFLRLPYAELSEPFTAYYEAKKNRSRIDYYGKFVCLFLLVINMLALSGYHVFFL